MKTLNIHEVEMQFDTVLLEIEKKGERFVILRNGEPIVDMIPHRQKSRLMPHPLLSQISINYDPTEPLSSDEWPEEE